MYLFRLSKIEKDRVVFVVKLIKELIATNLSVAGKNEFHHL